MMGSQKHRAGIYEKYIKRSLDILLSGMALIILSPVMLIVAILVRVKLGTPVIFCQERPGKDERIFKMHKFRTMTDARDADGTLLPDAERLTPFGKKLRSTSLDELPELWDIFRGKMSIVGPRPLLVKYLPYYTKYERHRHDIRPGLTGLAQVNGRNTVSWERRFELDVEYRNHLTFIQDVKIIIHTVKAVFSHDSIELNALENFDEYRNNQLRNTDINTIIGAIQK